LPNRPARAYRSRQSVYAMSRSVPYHRR
jgi:hypothetical protein